jgi:hypothetical protein
MMPLPERPDCNAHQSKNRRGMQAVPRIKPFGFLLYSFVYHGVTMSPRKSGGIKGLPHC